MHHARMTSSCPRSLLVTRVVAALLTALALSACRGAQWDLPTSKEKHEFEIATANDVAATANLPWESEAIYAHLELFLTQHPEVFGSTYSLDPAVTGKTLAPYVYRVNGTLMRKDLTQGGYDYSHQPWFTAQIVQRQAIWSEQYFDAGGGDVEMVTYSVPVVKDGKAIGVLTADFEIVKIAK